MKDWRFWIVFAVLTVVQIILCNFLDLSRYAVLSILPVLILMLPLRLGNVPMMLISFALGFAVDFFSTGMLGLTAAALVPVGLARNSLVYALSATNSARAKESSPSPGSACQNSPSPL